MLRISVAHVKGCLSHSRRGRGGLTRFRVKRAAAGRGGKPCLVRLPGRGRRPGSQHASTSPSAPLTISANLPIASAHTASPSRVRAASRCTTGACPSSRLYAARYPSSGSQTSSRHTVMTTSSPMNVPSGLGCLLVANTCTAARNVIDGANTIRPAVKAALRARLGGEPGHQVPSPPRPRPPLPRPGAGRRMPAEHDGGDQRQHPKAKPQAVQRVVPGREVKRDRPEGEQRAATAAATVIAIAPAAYIRALRLGSGGAGGRPP